MIVVTLPYPPSVNHYWRHVGPRVLISRQGREYREFVRPILAAIRREPLTGPLAVLMHIYPPDRRRRDLDNTQKALLDSLQAAGLYVDDSQIVDLHLIKSAVVAGGKVVAQIEEIQECHENDIPTGRGSMGFATDAEGEPPCA